MSRFKKFVDGVLLAIFWIAISFEVELILVPNLFGPLTKAGMSGSAISVLIGGIIFLVLMKIDFRKKDDNTMAPEFCGLGITSLGLVALMTSTLLVKVPHT